MTKIHIPWHHQDGGMNIRILASIWCTKHFGEEGATIWDPSVRWVYSGGGEFAFQREEDAVLFSLRWS